MSGDTEPINDLTESRVDGTQPDEKGALALALNDFDSQADPPPDGGYGWVCVASVFIINGFTWGITAVRSHAQS